MPIKIEIIGENGADVAALMADLKKHLAACDASPAAVAAVTNARVVVEAPPGKADPEAGEEPEVEDEDLPQPEPIPEPKKTRAKKAPASDGDGEASQEVSSPPFEKPAADLDKIKADAISLAVQIFARTKKGGPAKVKDLQTKYNVSKFADLKPDQVEAFATDVAQADEETKD
jgi:hypothetical protein